MNKEGHGEPTLTCVVWVYDSVGRDFKYAIGQVLNHISGVYDDLSLECMDGAPLPISLEQLESAVCGFAKKCNEVDVFVSSCTHRGWFSIIWNGRIMDNSQNGIPVNCHIGDQLFRFR